MAEAGNIVRVTNVTKTFKLGKIDVQALKGIDLEITRGDYISIMGPSGSGKSTLLNMMAGLEKPTKGYVKILGHEVTKMNEKKLAIFRQKHVGFVFQFFNLLPTLTTEENITLPLIIDGKNPKQYQERLDNLLELVGLSERRRHKPDQLSGGEQQRVSLARKQTLLFPFASAK